MKSLEDWRGAARTFEVGGRKIAWWAENENDQSKPWLLLIHGYPTSSWDWSAVWPKLCEHFRLAAIDMLGFGLSEKPRDIDYSILDQADLQEALLAHLGVCEAHLFCHDYGDTVGQELLARQNESVLSFSILSLCFLNGGLFPEKYRARPVQKLGLSPLGPLLGLLMSRAKLKKNFDQIFGPQTKASDAEIDGHWALIREHDGQKVLHKLLQYIPERIRYRDRWVGALTETHIPLRLIDGGVDPVSGAHLYYYYLEHVPDADAVLLADIGHYPHTEAPDAVASHFLEFHRTHRTIQ